MKSDATALRRKILLRLMLAPIAALAAFFLLWAVASLLPMAGVIQSVLRAVGMSRDTAYNVYRYLFANNLSLWATVSFILLFIAAAYVAVRLTSRSFVRMSEGVDRLLDEGDEPIRLPPEFDFLEARLNEAKNELRRRQQVAQQAEMRKNDLVVYLAHDIKTPLTSVIGYLSLLDEAPDMPSPQRARYIGITLEKAYRLEQLIDEFFDITRFNLQTIRLDREPVNLPHMLAQMADEFYPMLAPQGKAARVDCEEGLTVDADPDKLARVLNNILKNAAAYSDPNTVVSISARREGNSVHIAVENQGKTIPKQKLDSIFEMFYRLDTARSSHTGGAGLGLAIAKEIVEAHGGQISVRSEAGTTVFEIELPQDGTSFRG